MGGIVQCEYDKITGTISKNRIPMLTSEFEASAEMTYFVIWEATLFLTLVTC